MELLRSEARGPTGLPKTTLHKNRLDKELLKFHTKTLCQKPYPKPQLN